MDNGVIVVLYHKNDMIGACGIYYIAITNWGFKHSDPPREMT